MAQIDVEIDRLYQLPLAEFTSARNALAKSEADHRKVISRLQKPNVAAWAINQLYWRARKTYDALIRASEQLRATQARTLKGGQADVAKAERLHAAAVKDAADAVRGILREAGDAESPATINAVHETLQALPSNGPAGRLTRPLKPLGFDALAGLLTGKLPKGRATVLSFQPRTNAAVEKADKIAAQRAAVEAKRASAEARRQAEAHQKEIAKLKRELGQAQTAERAAADAVARAKQAVEEAEQDLERRRQASAEAIGRRQKIESTLRQLGV